MHKLCHRQHRAQKQFIENLQSYTNHLAETRTETKVDGVDEMDEVDEMNKMDEIDEIDEMDELDK